MIYVSDVSAIHPLACLYENCLEFPSYVWQEDEATKPAQPSPTRYILIEHTHINGEGGVGMEDMRRVGLSVEDRGAFLSKCSLILGYLKGIRHSWVQISWVTQSYITRYDN